MQTHHSSRLDSSGLPAWRFVAADEAVRLERWDADTVVHTSVAPSSWTSPTDLGGDIVEGVRPGRQRGGVAPLLYRPSHLGGGQLMPEADHLATAPRPSRRAVGPGDVIVSKFLPPRCALATSRAPRHAPDSNCLRIVGLDPAPALWLVALLEHPAFGGQVARATAGTLLPRLGARDLARLDLPPVPYGVDALVPRWQESANGLIQLRRELHELRQDAQAVADELAPPLPDAHAPTWMPGRDVPDTWAPDQVARVRYQSRLASRGWIALDTYLRDDVPRLRSRIPPARVLRLSDATGDFDFHLPELAEVKPPWFRLYADPLRPGEVLLSTLGSASKVVFHHPAVDSTVFVADLWVRIDGGVTPGALALLLETHQVSWQLQGATTGAVRQFVAREDVAAVRLPRLTREASRALHDRLVRLLDRRSALQTRIDAVRAELANLVSSTLEGAA